MSINRSDVIAALGLRGKGDENELLKDSEEKDASIRSTKSIVETRPGHIFSTGKLHSRLRVEKKEEILALSGGSPQLLRGGGVRCP